MKKKVWIINQYSVTPEYPASSRHYEMAKYLARDFNVTLWGSNFIHHNKKFRFSKWTIVKKQQMDGFLFNWLGTIAYSGNGIMRMLNMLQFAFMVLFVGFFRMERPDVIIGSSPPLFTAFSCMLLAKLKGASFLLEIRDLWPDSLIEISSKKQSLIISILRWMERTLYQHADQIIVLTQDIGETIQRRNVSKEKIHFLPNGIDMDTVIPSHNAMHRTPLRQSMGFNKEDFVFMYAGAHGPANDLGQLLVLAQQLKDELNIKFVLLGEGVEKTSLMQRAKELDLTRNLLFLPAVAKSEVYDYLSCADAFVICLKDIPLFRGALPNKLFDYLLFDKPIISTVSGEIETFLTQYQFGFFGQLNDENPDLRLSNVSLKVASQREKWTPGKAGVKIIQTYFNREKQMSDLTTIINHLKEK